MTHWALEENVHKSFLTSFTFHIWRKDRYEQLLRKMLKTMFMLMCTEVRQIGKAKINFSSNVITWENETIYPRHKKDEEIKER